ncbi:MAG: hypothetical protein QG610_1108, partial [Euryarchaeota archaeon]|nr:hypothetical protein [Euryarchaeota archaeon]
STQSAVGTEGSAGAPGTKSSAEGENLTAASVENNPLKVKIEYTDAKGERITVDKEVELEIIGGTARAGGPGQASGGISSYLPYIAVIVLAAGAFVYRKKIQERVQLMKEKKMKEKKSGNKKSEEQKSGLKVQ